MKHSDILITKPCADYELIDSGEGEKLERFGKVILARPDPQALWPKRLSAAEWKKADGTFGRVSSSKKGEGEKGERGDWSLDKKAQEPWVIDFANLKLRIKPTALSMSGFFRSRR